jgi:hypothetical protein
MSEQSYKTDKPLPVLIAEESARLKRSPLVAALKGSARGTLIAAPFGGALQALRGRNPLMGAAVAGLAGGAITGLSAASLQKYENVRDEAEMRYMLRNIVAREPMAAMPHPKAAEEAVYDGAFAQGFNSVYRPY